MGTIVSEPAVAPVREQSRAPSTSYLVPSFAVLVALITVVAALFRFHALGNRGFWLDETFSVDIAQNTSWNLLRVIGMREIDMGFYFVLLHFWMMLGDSETVVRSMSVVLSVATIPFTYLLGSRLFGRKTGLLAAGLLAVNAFHIRYAQEARSYALVVLLATVAAWLLVRNLQEPESASWASYGICLALMVYSHLLGGVLIAVSQYLAIAFLPTRRIPWRGLTRATLWAGCLTAPMAIIFPMAMAKSNPLNWVHSLDWLAVSHFFVLASGNRGLLLLALDAGMVGVAIFVLLRTAWKEGRSLDGWSFVFVLLWFFVPIAVLLAISAFRDVFVPRYLLPCLPGFLLAVSAGLMRVRPRSIAWTLGTAIFALSLAGISSCYDLKGVVDDWRVITSGVLSQAKPADGVFFYPAYSRTPFQYYRTHQTPVPEWPIEVSVDSADQTGQTRPAGLTRTAHRLWVVFHHPSPLFREQREDMKRNLAGWRADGWNLSQVQEFPNVTVLLFSGSDTAVATEALPNLFQFRQAADSH